MRTIIDWLVLAAAEVFAYSISITLCLFAWWPLSCEDLCRGGMHQIPTHLRTDMKSLWLLGLLSIVGTLAGFFAPWVSHILIPSAMAYCVGWIVFCVLSIKDELQTQQVET